MFILSVNYKKTGIALRERFSFAEPAVLSLLERFNGQAVYLSTCNRCEFYGTGDAYAALELLCTASGADRNILKQSVLIFTDRAALRHLFRVAAGLDSMVLGEDEILGQLKRAFLFSQNHGFSGYELNTAFKAAITAAKKVKTETLLSKSSVSIATLAASACHNFSGGKHKHVLMIGAGGEIGSKTAKNLLSYPEFELTAVTRGNHIPIPAAAVIPYSRRYDAAAQADIIISATASPHFTLTCENLRRAINTSKPRLLIDLASPRDIDPDAANLDGVTLMTIDDFAGLAQRNNAAKQNERIAAEEILDRELDVLRKELAFHALLPDLRFENETMRFLYTFRDTANADEFELFAGVLKRMQEADSVKTAGNMDSGKSLKNTDSPEISRNEG